jgi:hypothetical protein
MPKKLITISICYAGHQRQRGAVGYSARLVIARGRMFNSCLCIFFPLLISKVAQSPVGVRESGLFVNYEFGRCRGFRL